MSDPLPPSSSPPAAAKRFPAAVLAGGGLAVAALAASAIYYTKLRQQAAVNQADERVLATRAVQQTLREGILAFHAGENRFPVPPGFPGGEESPMRSDETIKDGLMGQDPIINPKNKSYLGAVPAAAEAPAHAAGLATAAGRAAIVDAWGAPYFLLWDANGDGVIANPDPAGSPRELRETVLVFSAGPDGDAATWEDNVASWVE